MGPRTDEALRGVMGVNHNQAADAAGLLGIPLFNVHSAADNMVQAYLTDLFEEKEPERLGDIVDALMGEPEYREAAKSNARPRIMVGSRDSRCGRVMCKMTGGTSGPKSMYEALARAGVGTVVCMHCPESHYEAAREAHVNIVISGHMPSDSLGVNLIADVWEREGIDVVPCSGLIRCSRNRHVRPQVHSHTRRLQARLRLRAQDPRPPRGADGQDGDALPPAGHGRPRVHRVPDRGRWDRQDRHREEVLRGHGGLHGRPRQADRHDLRELQELLRGGGAPADDTPLRRGVPGEGLLHRGHGPHPRQPPVDQQARAGRDPRRGGRPAQEGLHRHSVPAHQGAHVPVRARLRDNGVPGARGVAPRRGLHVHLPQVEHGEVQPLQQAGAPRDRRRPRRGGALRRRVLGGRAGPDSGGGGRVRRRQDGDRAAGPRRQHGRGRGRGRDDHRARPRRQGDDLQLGVGHQAPLSRPQPQARAARHSQGDEEEPFHTVVRRREDVRDSVRGVRRPGQEAHPVLELRQGPGQHRRDRPRHRERQLGQGFDDIPSGHPVEGAGTEDGGPAGRRRG